MSHLALVTNCAATGFVRSLARVISNCRVGPERLAFFFKVIYSFIYLQHSKIKQLAMGKMAGELREMDSDLQ